MNEELMITKEDLVNWLNRPPSNDDLDLIGFMTTRLDNFYKLEQENKQLKELTDKYEEEHKTTFETWLKEINILTELEKWLKYQFEHTLQQNNYHSVLDEIQELKEKYK